MLDVEGHGLEHVAELAVEVGELFQVTEVEVGVLAVAQAANVLGEELAVGVDAEELAFGAQMLGSILLGAELEGDALGLHVRYLLLDGEQRLVVPSLGGIVILAFVHAAPPFP